MQKRIVSLAAIWYKAAAFNAIHSISHPGGVNSGVSEGDYIGF